LVRGFFFIFATVLASSTARAQDATFFTLPSRSAGGTSPPVATTTEREDDSFETPAAPFGARGQLAVQNETSLDVQYTEYPSHASFLYLDAEPSIDWFCIQNLSLGLAARADYSDTKGFGADGSLVRTRSSYLSGGLRLGVNAPLGRWMSFYPHVELGVYGTHRDLSLVSGSSLSIVNPVGGPSTSNIGPWVELYAPLLIHPFPRFFIGAGPVLFHQFGRVTGGPDVGAEQSTIGARATVGVHWGGTTARASDEQPKRRRFGEQRDVVISGESGLALRQYLYQGIESSAVSFGFSPSVDVFVFRRIAVGGSASISYYDSHGVDAASGQRLTIKQLRLGFGPRVAVDLPMARWLSFYPRLRVLVGYEDNDERSAQSANAYTDVIVNLGIYAPLLFHVGSHAFVGLGPVASYDVLRRSNHGYNNQGWSVGASWIIGGWI
jgi:hypothetical protein